MKLPKTTCWLVDAIGALAVATALAIAAWLGVVESAEARTAVAELRVEMATYGRTLSGLNLQRNEQTLLLADHERALSGLGGGDANATSEGYLRTVSALARDLDVRVIQHQQLGERLYPGLREQLFSLTVAGTTENLWRLLRAIEGIDAWADVSYLKIEGGAAHGDRMAALTISMFSERDQATSRAGSEGGDD